MSRGQKLITVRSVIAVIVATLLIGLTAFVFAGARVGSGELLPSVVGAESRLVESVLIRDTRKRFQELNCVFFLPEPAVSLFEPLTARTWTYLGDVPTVQRRKDVLAPTAASDAVPILYYDFENNTTRTTFENAVEQSVNGSGTLTLSTISGGLGVSGAGTYNGGAAAGQAITATNWSSSTTDPGTAAANFFQFTTSTTGFSGISLTFDEQASATGPARVGLLYSTDFGSTYSAVSTVLTGNGAFSTATFDLTGISAVNNQGLVFFRIYGFAGSAGDRTGRSAFGSTGTFRIDNLTVRSNTATASKTLLDYPAIGLSIESGSPFTPSYGDFTVNAPGGTVNLPSTLSLASGANLTINNGTLALTSNGSVQGSGTIAIASGATFDVTGSSTTETLGSGQGLTGTATGSNTTGTITTSGTRNLVTSSTTPITFTQYGGGATAPLTVSGAGKLTITGGSTVTVNTTSQLTAGTYTLISKGASGLVDGSAPSTPTITGSGICLGCSASLSIISGQLSLVVTAPPPPSVPTITGSTPTSPGSSTTPTINGTADAGNTVKLYKSNDCLSGFAGMGTATGGNFAIGVTVSANSGTTFYAAATDAFSNVSACSSGFNFVSDTTAPTVSYSPIDDTNSTSAIPFNVNAVENVSMGTVSVFYAVNGGSFSSSSCTPGSLPAYTCIIPGQATNTAVSYYVSATDTAGNNRLEPSGGATGPNLYSVGIAAVPAGTYSNMSLGEGATFGGDVVVNSVLKLSGIVSTGSNTLEIGCAGSVTRTIVDSYVVGIVKKDICSAGTFIFPIGTTPDGSRPQGTLFGNSLNAPRFAGEYSPLWFSVQSGTFPATATVTVNDTTLTGLDPAKSVSRSWNIAQTGGPLNVDLFFFYLDQDVNGTEADYKVFKRETTVSTEVTPSFISADNNFAKVSGVTSFSAWGIGLLSPTAASVSISGRVLTADGRAVPGALVTVSGNGLDGPRTVRSGPSGGYVIRDLEAGQTYIVSIISKRFRFRAPDRLVNLGDDLTGFDFVALP